MLSIEECRRQLGDTNMSDNEIQEFLESLRSYLNTFLDDYNTDPALNDAIISPL